MKGMGKGTLHAGLTRKNPPGIDKSMGLKGPNVAKDATRSGPAATPKTLGPRTA